jgi:hypothetical protein
MHFKSGLVYEGGWYNGKENGFGVLYELDGTVYNGEWLEGVQHGEGEYLYESGQIFRGLFENGKIYYIFILLLNYLYFNN